MPYSDFLADKKKKTTRSPPPREIKATTPYRESKKKSPIREHKVISNDYHKSNERKMGSPRRDKRTPSRERKIKSPSRECKVRSSPDMSTQSKEDYVQVVYMREEDVNRLIRKGYLHFYKGKLRYKETTKRHL